MDIDLAHLKTWQGRGEVRSERISAVPARCLAALLNDGDSAFAEGCELPPAWQWLHFLPCVRQDELGDDGHPRRGGFLPPVPLARRMWAAGRMTIAQPLRIGDQVTRTTRIEDISSKEGRSGRLVFVRLSHEYATAAGVAIDEEQDLVYRAQSGAVQVAPAGQPAPVDATWAMEIAPDPVLLFRYSALTFNAHRIHYDRDYAINREHYPTLVVHGPLIATLMLELLRRHLPAGRRVREYRFRAVQPTFVDTPFWVCARPGAAAGSFQLWSRTPAGILTIEAAATTT